MNVQCLGQCLTCFKGAICVRVSFLSALLGFCKQCFWRKEFYLKRKCSEVTRHWDVPTDLGPVRAAPYGLSYWKAGFLYLTYSFFFLLLQDNSRILG